MEDPRPNLNTDLGLTIVIPALNEEAAIGDTIRRCLDAREQIRTHAGIGDIEVIVVSDGSTDRTEAIARSFDEVTVLAFETNHGYGAALKCGFEHGQGELLAFLDADGTCEPAVLAQLCRVMVEQDADVVLGSRMGPDSRMPWVRSIGNTLFAWMLGVLSKRRIQDTASGMRVLRRSALDDLYPLPDGLHFTPAMSARILLEGKLKLIEVPMAYAERTGRSKLSVVRDGTRFLAAIVQAAMCYRPARPLLVAAAGIGLLALVIGLLPVAFYLKHGRLEEWMIYRIMLSSLLITIAGFVVCTAVTAERVAAAAHGRSFGVTGATALLSRLFAARARRGITVALLLTAVALVWAGIVEFLSTGHLTMHWSRPLLASLLIMLAAMHALTVFVLNMVDLIERQHAIAERRIAAPDRLQRATPRES